MTTADAFAHYYSHFTRDQDHFESQLARLKTPVKVIWGEKDLYIKKEMGVEFAERIQRRTHASSRHRALPSPAEPEAGHR